LSSEDEARVALAPCPFCGDGDAVVGPGVELGVQVTRCQECGATGPRAGTGARASEAWARRVSRQSSAVAVEGSVPGFTYVVGTGTCVYCERKGVAVLRSKTAFNMLGGTITATMAPAGQGACELCSRAAAIAWRGVEGDLAPGQVLPDVERACMVLVMRDRLPGEGVAREMLVTPRKDDEGVVSFPGGKLEPGEDAIAAGVRELRQETGLVTWPEALEPLYLGHSPRGAVVRIMLARAWHGKVVPCEGEPMAEWRPDVLSGDRVAQFGPMRWFYRAVGEALEMRAELASSSGSTLPLSLEMSRAAAEHVTLRAAALKGERSESRDADAKMAAAFQAVMSEHERGAASLILDEVRRRVEASRPSAAPAEQEGAKKSGDAEDDGVVDAEWDEAEGSPVPARPSLTGRQR